MTLKYRKQEHVLGCGLACVAMIANCSYYEVKYDYDELFGAPERVYNKVRRRTALDYGTTASDLRNLLKIYDIQSYKRFRKFKSWDDLPNTAILAVNYREFENYTAWHWVVFDRESNAVYDPWVSEQQKKVGIKQNIRKDYKRMNPRMYLGIVP